MAKVAKPVSSSASPSRRREPMPTTATTSVCNREKRVVVLGKADGSWHELATAKAPIEFGKSYRLRVVAKGPKIDVYLNDKQVLSEEDPSFAEGSVGVRDYFPNGDQRNATFSGIKAKAL